MIYLWGTTTVATDLFHSACHFYGSSTWNYPCKHALWWGSHKTDMTDNFRQASNEVLPQSVIRLGKRLYESDRTEREFQRRWRKPKHWFLTVPCEGQVHWPQPSAACAGLWWLQCRHCGLFRSGSGYSSLGGWQTCEVCTAVGMPPGWRWHPISQVPKSWGRDETVRKACSKFKGRVKSWNISYRLD